MQNFQSRGNPNQKIRKTENFKDKRTKTMNMRKLGQKKGRPTLMMGVEELVLESEFQDLEIPPRLGSGS